MNKRIKNAKGIEIEIGLVLTPLGLSLSGFQFPMMGKLEFTVEVDCESVIHLEQVWDIMVDFLKDRNLKMKTSTANIVPNKYKAIFVLELVDEDGQSE